MVVPFPNAFTINGLGLGGSFFPLSARVELHSSGISSMNICPLRVCDIVDLVADRSGPVYFLSDVAQQSWTDPVTRDWLEFDEAVAKFGVPCRPYGRSAAAFSKPSFVRIASEMNHYTFHALDLPVEPTEEEGARLIQAIKDFDLEEPLVSRFNDAHIFVSSHDDCYLYVESVAEALLKSILARTLWFYCTTVVPSRMRHRVTEPPHWLVERLCPEGSAFTVLRKDTTVRRGSVTIGYSKQEYRFGEHATYPLAGEVRVDLLAGVWSLSEA